MSWSFNPFTGNMDLTGSSGAVVFEGEVETFADLPEVVGDPPVGSSYLVRTSTGVWLVNRRQAGIWIRRNNTGVRATDWEYGGDYPVNSVAGKTGNVTLTNSDISGLGTAATADLNAISDADLRIVGSTDSTKKVAIEVDTNVPTNTVVTLTAPSSGGTIARTSDIPSTFAASAITSGVLDNARVNFAAPSAIGSTTPNTVAATDLSASNKLSLPSAAAASPTAGDLYRNANTIRYRDSTNTERLLLNATDNLSNLANTATARANLGLGTAATANLDALSDSAFRIADNGDATKKLAFELSGISTATTRTLTVPNGNATIAAAPETRNQTFFSSTTYNVAEGLNVELQLQNSVPSCAIVVVLPRLTTDGARNGDEILLRPTSLGSGSSYTLQRYIWTGSSYTGSTENITTMEAGQTYRLRLVGGMWTLLVTPNLASPPAIGSTTPAAATFTNLSANTRVNLPNTNGTTAGDLYRNANTLRYRDSTNTERLLLNATDNLSNLANTATARANLGLGDWATLSDGATLRSQFLTISDGESLDYIQLTAAAGVIFSGNRAAQFRGALGLGTSNNVTFGSIQNTPIGSTTPAAGSFSTLSATVNGLATTPTQGLTLRNSTAAASGAQQVSPFLSLAGQGWDSGTNSSREVEFGWHVIPVQANPVMSELVLRHRVAGGAWTNVASFFSGNNTNNTTVFTLNGAFGTTTFRRGGNNDIAIDQNLRVGGGYIRLDAGGSNIAFLLTDANDVFAQRNGVAAQEYRIYGQYTSASNFERLSLKYNSTATAFQIGTEKGTGSPSGTARPLEFQTDGVTRMTIAATGGNINMGTAAVFGITGLQFDSAASFRFSSGSIGSSSDLWILRSGSGIMRISTGSGDNDFNRLQFGGTTSSFPALKRSSTTLQVRLADDSADAPLSSASLTSGDGTRTSLAYLFASDTDTGFYRRGTDTITFVTGGSNRFEVSGSQVRLEVNQLFGWTFNDLSGSLDLVLRRDAADTLAQRRDGNAQTFRIYNTSTSSNANFERANFRWASNEFIIDAEAGGTGTSLRGIKIGSATSSLLGFYGATPVTQRAAIADATDAATTQARLNDLLAAMRSLGLIAT